MARARTGGLGVFVPLTFNGDCHGHEEKSQEENVQEKSVVTSNYEITEVAGTKSRKKKLRRRSAPKPWRRRRSFKKNGLETGKKVAFGLSDRLQALVGTNGLRTALAQGLGLIRGHSVQYRDCLLRNGWFG